MDQTLSIIFFIAAVFIAGGLLFVIITIAKRGPVGLDVEKYRSKWLSIEQQLERDNLSACQMCVLNADKLLDQAMIEKGVAGKTMGDRLKQLQTQWTNANNVWSAHKLRNKIAHEPDISVDYHSVKSALAGFKQALKDIGAI